MRVDDVSDELGHARHLAERIKQPGSSQESLQPPPKSTHAEAVVDGVIAADVLALSQCRDIAEAADGFEYVTQELAIHLMVNEEEFSREFQGLCSGFETEELIST